MFSLFIPKFFELMKILQEQYKEHFSPKSFGKMHTWNRYSEKALACICYLLEHSLTMP